MLLGVFFFAIVMFGIGIYRLGWQGGFAYRLSAIIPYPAALVDWEPIRFFTFVDDYNTLIHYWDVQRENSNVFLGIPDNNDIRERLMKKLIDEKFIQIWARARSITVGTDEIEQEWQRLLAKPNADTEVDYFLADAYGWSEATFKQRVLQPFLLRQKVESIVSADHEADETALLKRANDIHDQAVSGEGDFESLAREYSGDEFSARNSGDMGYIPRGTFEPNVEEALFSMNIGDISDPIPSSLGYHIIRLDDLLYDDAGVPARAAVHQILIKSFDFDAWLVEQEQSLSIYRLVL